MVHCDGTAHTVACLGWQGGPTVAGAVTRAPQPTDDPGSAARPNQPHPAPTPAEYTGPPVATPEGELS